MQLPEWEGEFRGVSLHLLIKKIQGQYIRITSQNTTQNLCQKNTPNKTSSFLPYSFFFFFFLGTFPSTKWMILGHFLALSSEVGRGCTGIRTSGLVAHWNHKRELKMINVCISSPPPPHSFDFIGFQCRALFAKLSR